MTSATAPELYVKMEEIRPALDAMLRVARKNGIHEYQRHIKVDVREHTIHLETCDGFRLVRRVVPHHLGVTGNFGLTYLTVSEVKEWLADSPRWGLTQLDLPEREVKWPDTDKIIPRGPFRIALNPVHLRQAVQGLRDDVSVYLVVEPNQPAALVSVTGIAGEEGVNLTVIQGRLDPIKPVWDDGSSDD